MAGGFYRVHKHIVKKETSPTQTLKNDANGVFNQMKKCGDHITILVIDEESEKHYLQQRMPILPTPGLPHNLPHTARKLQLLSDSRGFGFLLRLEKTCK